MHESVIALVGVNLVSTVPRPLVRGARVAVDPVIVGFDTEWSAPTKSLLSVQLAMQVDGKLVSKIVYPSEPRLTSALVAEIVAMLLRRVDRVPAAVRGVRRVTLVAHFAAAEMSMFEDALRELRITQIGKAHHATLPLLEDGDGTTWSIRIVDLFAYYKTSLEEIGKTIGLPKIEQDRDRLGELLQADRTAFEVYAVRDAEIVVLAFNGLRDTVLRDWAIDILFVPTLPAIASSIFRGHFLGSAPVLTKKSVAAVRRRLKTGWTTALRTYFTYDGPPERRIAACRAYWGGRVEAFGRGLVIGPVVERDVVSLYPSAALLQPLPNEATKWKRVTDIVDVMHMEGFGNFRFVFPREQRFPCLPVTREGVSRLLFTSKGETSCTFAEIRASLELGATVDVINAWGFEPGPNERDHDLGKYVRHFLAEKAAASKGTLAYETAKLLLNALIGKFGERRQSTTLLEFERAARDAGSPGLGGIIARSSTLRSALSGAPGVGRLWVPEWACLIVGRARAIMASIVAKGALLVSTDAVLVPPDLDLDSTGLRALRSVGSDLETKVEGDAAFISRSRMYAVLQHTDRVRGDAPVLARDQHWAVVRVARHASVETKEQFAETVLACLAAEQDIAPVRQKIRLASAETAVREDRGINEEVIREGRTRFGWDSKRRLADRDVNPFRSFTTTTPYLTLGKIEGAEHQRDVRDGKARTRRRAPSKQALADVVALLATGRGVRETSRATGVSKSTVSDMKRMLEKGGAEIHVALEGLVLDEELE